MAAFTSAKMHWVPTGGTGIIKAKRRKAKFETMRNQKGKSAKKGQAAPATPRIKDRVDTMRALKDENGYLRSELEDLRLLYEATIEHGEAVEEIGRAHV